MAYLITDSFFALISTLNLIRGIIMTDEDHAVLEHYVPFCPKCGNECEQKELRRALDTENWKKIIIETIFYCKRCDNYWSDGLVVKGYK